MTELEFFAWRVKLMRLKQKDYFKTRNSEILREAKGLEREIDQKIKAIGSVWLNIFDRKKEKEEN